MLLSNLSNFIKCEQILHFKKDKNIKFISSNSKIIRKNSIFVSDFKKKIKKNYFHEAIKNGAIGIITNKLITDIKVPQFKVKNVSLSMKKILYKIKYKAPNNIVGITGTNGKTSVVWMISNIVNLCKLDVISYGTLGLYKDLKKINDSILTTPESEILYQAAFSSNSNNKTEFIFEVSSHGISKKRIEGFPINIAAITNISQDHLDFHKTMKNYRNTKYKLFLKYLLNKGIAVLNDNIDGIARLKKQLEKKNIKIITYGKNKSDINCSIYKKDLKLKVFKRNYIIKYKIVTEFELQNLSCSISCCIAMGLPLSKIIKTIPKITKAEGRMQLVDKLYNSAKVFVDYAHTPEALKKILLSNFKNKQKPDLLFGCGGDRDKSKRKIMGKIACKYANNVYITDDNPRNENPSLIRKNIFSQCKRAIEIGNRKKAIKIAIKNLQPKSILIIAGKGHEKNQIQFNKIISFDDVKISKLYINKINANASK